MPVHSVKAEFYFISRERRYAIAHKEFLAEVHFPSYYARGFSRQVLRCDSHDRIEREYSII